MKLKIILCLLIIVLSTPFYSHTLEDAFISFRYAKYFSEGYPLGTWNTREALSVN